MRYLLCAAALCIPATSVGAQSKVEKLYAGNTITGVYAEGSVVFKLRPDGTVSGTTPDGKSFAGHWVASGQFLCIVHPPEKPNSGIPSRCEMVDAAKQQVGKSWRMTDSYGLPATVTITKGL